MDWIEIQVITTNEAADAISEILIDSGSGGTSIDDPSDLLTCKNDENNWDYVDDSLLKNIQDKVTIKAYFTEGTNVHELLETIKQRVADAGQFLDIGAGEVSVTTVKEDDWANNWKKYYKPFKITENILIKPTWEIMPHNIDDNVTVIEMDPGMAFGTGTHETTRLCAGFIEKYVKDGDTAIDVGCGTGILSIVAAKMGAYKVQAIDIDSLAVKVTNQNTVQNAVDNKIVARKAMLSDILQEKHDIIFANIVANVIIDISDIIPYYLKASGHFICSGIIKDRVLDVQKAYRDLGFEMLEIQYDGEWAAMVYKLQ